MGVVWFLLGAFVGFDAAMAYAWHSLRRARQSGGVTGRVKPYVGQRRWPW